MRKFGGLFGHTARFALLALLLVGCAPLVGGGSWLLGLLVCTLASALMLLGAPLSAQADRPPPSSSEVRPGGPEPGPPPPKPVCSGWEHQSCYAGNIQTSCCPKNAKCNYAYAPFVECGPGTCAPGFDVGMCPEPQPRLSPKPATDQANCGGNWAKVCSQGKVTNACTLRTPTNYMGPPTNPRFTECGNDRCTTSQFQEVCYPAKGEIKDKDCKWSWQKSCYRGKVTTRCIPDPPTNYSGVFYQTLQYVDCGDNRCAVGTDKKVCQK